MEGVHHKPFILAQPHPSLFYLKPKSRSPYSHQCAQQHEYWASSKPMVQLTLPMLRLLSSTAYQDAKIFDKHPNPGMLVFIIKPSPSTFRWVPMCQGFSHIPGCFFASFCIGKIIATTSIRVELTLMLLVANSANAK